ncbi:MAG: amidohydrolase/deacetylase family metallohydrolase [Candidatus Poribacteria bacterium]|nr:amidohydrolase/deacetylase family metallohydrolase [Candidatus Poribacteria bacterium]
MKTLDLLLKGGHVLDPANRIDGTFDVGIRGDRIAAVAASIPSDSAEHVVDMTGLIVVPGLIDIHTHAYHTRHWGVGSLNADAHFLKEGVTTCVDTGTAGHDEFADFYENVMRASVTRILAYVNISAPGMGDPEQVVANLDPRKAAETASAFSQVCVGIKTAHYWVRDPFDAEHPPWASVELAVEAGDLCGMPVMVDFWPRPPKRPYPDLILKKLRPGDIHTHVFARQFPVIDSNGKVYDYMFEARERGIHFDLGHGAASFWYRNAVPALEQGFPPDSISTDLHMGNINGHVHSMLDTMSKCLAMGMPLSEVVYRSTVTPAKAIRRTELGTLTVGAEADVAALRNLKGDFAYRDCGWGRIDGNDRLECALTVRSGKVVWDRDARTVPHWSDGDDAYFELTATQVPIRRMWRDE